MFEATGGQIDAISQDADVDHIAGNAKVFRMMAVTTQATGADQVWRGLEHLRGVTGHGVGIAVIDSGIANHAALRDRVVAVGEFHRPARRPARTTTATARTSPASSPQDGRDGAAGMAPGASLVNLKVLGRGRLGQPPPM